MLRVASIVFCFLLSSLSYSNTAFTQRKDVQLFVNSMVKEHHFSARELNKIMSQVQLQSQIIDSMERPYEKKNWDVYRDLFLTPQRLNSGINFWRNNQEFLQKAEKQYGVPAEVIVAILGVETLYGERQGQYRVLDALATLAFEYPKRSPYFTRELKEFLLLCREHKVPATQYLGSYAGAMGQPQFMPSSYRYYAVDYHHKGTRDLMSNNADSIASVANYFYKHGWRTNQGVAQNARISGYRYRQIVMNPKTANYPYSQLEAAGIFPVTASYNHPTRAALMEMVTTKGNEYWLAYPNFFVITRYNSSPQYALVVYLLSQQLKKQWIASNSKTHRAYV
jgi:membrane-bound lytic murein transglycosylase B